VVELAIGARPDESPLPDKNAAKNAAAGALGKPGGAKDGATRTSAP